MCVKENNNISCLHLECEISDEEKKFHRAKERELLSATQLNTYVCFRLPLQLVRFREKN